MTEPIFVWLWNLSDPCKRPRKSGCFIRKCSGRGTAVIFQCHPYLPQPSSTPSKSLNRGLSVSTQPGRKLECRRASYALIAAVDLTWNKYSGAQPALNQSSLLPCGSHSAQPLDSPPSLSLAFLTTRAIGFAYIRMSVSPTQPGKNITKLETIL